MPEEARPSPSTREVGCSFVIALLVGVLIAFWAVTGIANNRRDICDLRLASVTTEADSTAIYDERWPWYLPADWRKCPREKE